MRTNALAGDAARHAARGSVASDSTKTQMQIAGPSVPRRPTRDPGTHPQLRPLTHSEVGRKPPPEARHRTGGLFQRGYRVSQRRYNRYATLHTHLLCLSAAAQTSPDAGPAAELARQLICKLLEIQDLYKSEGTPGPVLSATIAALFGPHESPRNQLPADGLRNCDASDTTRTIL